MSVEIRIDGSLGKFGVEKKTAMATDICNFVGITI